MEATLNGPFGRMTLGPSNLAIGRTPDNQLVVNDTRTSSHHAEVRPQGQGYSIVDLKSTNGTFVNEQRLEPYQPRPLNAGDVIRIGDTRFTYEVSGAYNIAPTVYAQPTPGNDGGYDPTVVAQPQSPDYGPDGQQGYQGGYQPIPPSPYEQPQQGFYAAPPPPPPIYAPPPLGQAGLPDYAQPVQPTPRKSRRGLWIALGVIGGVLLLVCIACGVIGYAFRSTPQRTLSTFCDDLKSGNFHDGYQQLSASTQSQTSEADFDATMQRIRTAGGGLRDCVPQNVTDNGSTGSGVLNMTFNATPQPAFFDTGLVDESGTWKINSLQLRQ